MISSVFVLAETVEEQIKALQDTQKLDSQILTEQFYFFTVVIARAEVSFTPDRHQVRLVQQGVPPRSYWGVSFVKLGPAGRPTRVEVFLVDAKTGDVRPA